MVRIIMSGMPTSFHVGGWLVTTYFPCGWLVPWTVPNGKDQRRTILFPMLWIKSSILYISKKYSKLLKIIEAPTLYNRVICSDVTTRNLLIYGKGFTFQQVSGLLTQKVKEWHNSKALCGYYAATNTFSVCNLVLCGKRGGPYIKCRSGVYSPWRPKNLLA